MRVLTTDSLRRRRKRTVNYYAKGIDPHTYFHLHNLNLPPNPPILERPPIEVSPPCLRRYSVLTAPCVLGRQIFALRARLATYDVERREQRLLIRIGPVLA